MKVLNVHKRELNSTTAAVGALLDTLASRRDRLWPGAWPRMEFDRPLGVGAVGGHGPIRYAVETYNPGSSIRFRFTGPRGFDGFHELTIDEVDSTRVIIVHTLSMKVHGSAALMWLILFRPLHDALIEDAFTRAESSLALQTHLRPWSLWVRVLRWLTSGGKARRQEIFASSLRGAH